MGAPRHTPITLPAEAGDRGYIAGLLDGEGCISVSVARGPRSAGPSHGMSVSISNTDEGVMAWLLATIGGAVHRSRGGKRPVYSWRVSGDNAFTFLRWLIPELKIKRGQAELALRLESLRSYGVRVAPEVVVERDEIRAAISRLNHGAGIT